MHNARFIWRGIILLVILALAVFPVSNNQKAYAQQAVYQEDFEGGPPQGWTLEPGWSVVTDGNTHVLAGEGHSWARSNQTYRSDYRLSFRLKVKRGTIHLVYDLNDAGRYFIEFEANGSRLNKQYWPGDFKNDLISKDTRHELNTWHQVEVTGRGGTLEFQVDGNREWKYTDAKPLDHGSFAFEALDGSQVEIDDIVVVLDTQPGVTPSPASKVAVPPSAATDLTWVRLGGPLGGLGYDIRIVPGAPDHMYVTDAWSGVNISTDSGLTWTPSNEGISTRTGSSGDAIPVFCLTIDPNDTHILWVGTQYLRGIFKSTDEGRTWTKMVSGVSENNGISFRGFTVEPGNSNVVYAAAEISSWAWSTQEQQGREFDRVKGVVYKTTDGGQSWKAIWRGDNLARYIWIDPRNTDVLYISTGIFDREAANSDPKARLPGGEGVVKSSDGGKTWTSINNGLGNLYVGSLFMHPRNPDILMAGTGNNQYSEGAGVYLTTDGGGSWIKTLSDDIIESVEYSAQDPNIAYAGSKDSIYRSEDGGHTWVRISGGPTVDGWGPPGVRAGFPIDFQMDPKNSNRIFANEYGGGNFLSEDGGRTWTVASTGYTGAQVRALAVHPTQPGQVYASARSGIFTTYEGGVHWTGLNTAPVRSMEWTAVAIDPADPLHLLASNNWEHEIMFSKDAGKTWQSTGANLGETRMGWRVIVFAPSEPDLAYAGSAGYYSAGTFDPKMPGDGVYFSGDGGKTWQRSSDELMHEAHITGLAVDPQNPRLVFAAGIGKGILRSSDGGQTWEAIQKGLRNLNAESIAIQPDKSDILLAGLWEGGIYKSSDGGQTWKQTGHGMAPEASVTSIVFDPVNPQLIYAADVLSGVYRSQDGGSNWQPIVKNLRMRAVNALAISSDGQHLYAATEGDGVYRLDLNGQPPASAAVPEPVISNTQAVTSTSRPVPSSTPVSGANPLCGGTGFLLMGVLALAGWRWSSGK